ncbi:hypothetical protein HYDPIDRAFT_93839 [Hydnomerulius pinastri MD-312]|uniref:Uncharacterized protein n=1 Tax=Hydnomerulius pinastri MD-312 TaxID=994086 RepID=A0A0C9VA17_9AGAM|nr:hypothetical protein HYDPIDRAFT_93839 [Hydnomerulius pinastri MD-312]
MDIKTFTEVDLSQPIAVVLRAGTAQAHAEVESSQGATWIMKGQLLKEEYVFFLMMLWYIYSTLERGLEKHSEHPVLQPTYYPSLLERGPKLAADIAFLLNTPESTWKFHSLHVALVASPPPAFTAYLERLRELSDAEDPSPLLAHAYIRYMGDMSGGQQMRRSIVKAYGLDSKTGSGVEFYAFGWGNETAKWCFERPKAWFRDGMNTGVGDNVRLKEIILEEALLAFKLNHALFDSLRGPLMDHDKGSHEARGVGSVIKALAQQDLGALLILRAVISLAAALCLAQCVLVLSGIWPSDSWSKLAQDLFV